MKIVCTICARGGSKGLPGKNIKQTAGKPLIVHTIEQALKNDLINKIIVSTDCPKIAEIAKRAGAEVPFMRSAELASDTAAKLPVIKHAVKFCIENQGYYPDIVIDMDPTSPLRSQEDINNALNFLISETDKYDSVISGYSSDKNPYFNMVIENNEGYARLCREEYRHVTRRQDAPQVYCLNASIYAWRTQSLMDRTHVLDGKLKFLEMPAERSVDIDSDIDHKFVKYMLENQQKTEKLVLISGGLGVMGQAFSKVLHEDGYSCLLLDVNDPKPEKEYIGKFFKCDISNETDIENLKNYLSTQNCEIHSLINNASCQPEGFTRELEDYIPDTFRKVLDVNLIGSFLLCQTVIPYMRKQNFGSIINIGSIQGIVAPTFEIYDGMGITSPLVYAVAKAGIIHFSKWMAAKYGKYNIRCNALSPGGLGDSQKGGDKFPAIYASKTPLNRMAHSTEIADAIMFLISDKSKYITGQNIAVDGGWTAQ